MARVSTLCCAVLILVADAHGVLAHPAPSIELVQCREARIAARQAVQLVRPLMDLGLQEAQAVAYLTAFQQSVDACETNTRYAVPILPPFPPAVRIPGLDVPGVALEGGPGRLVIADPNEAAAYAGPEAFLGVLEGYQHALGVQCGATFTLARVAPTQAIFDALLETASFGRCAPGSLEGTEQGDLPQIPSVNAEERACQAEVLSSLQELVVDPCPNNPVASQATGSGTSPSINDEWRERNRVSGPQVTTIGDQTSTTNEYEGRDGEGNLVKLTTSVTTDSAGNVVYESTRVEVTNVSDGSKTTIVTVWENGIKTIESERVVSQNGELIMARNCNPNCGEPVFGPAHPTNQEGTKQTSDLIDEAWKWLGRMADVLQIYQAVSTFGRMRQCARYPGGEPSPLFFKDSRGVELDTMKMMRQCTCRAQAQRCPLCTSLGIVPATSCETDEERLRRECLMNPYGPRDEPRPECLSALRQDNPDVNLEARLCGTIMCVRGVVSITIMATKTLGCGCFAPITASPAEGPEDRFCGVARCESGVCTCHGTGGTRTCGCVVPITLPLNPPPVPVNLGPPVLTPLAPSTPGGP